MPSPYHTPYTTMSSTEEQKCVEKTRASVKIGNEFALFNACVDGFAAAVRVALEAELVILPLSILFLIFKVFDLLKSLIVLGRTRCCRFVSTPLSYLARLIAIVQRPIIGLLAMIITMINHSILKGVANSLGQGDRLDRTEQNVWLIYKDTVDILVIGFSVKKRHPELRGTTLIFVKDQNQEIITN